MCCSAAGFVNRNVFTSNTLATDQHHISAFHFSLGILPNFGVCVTSRIDTICASCPGFVLHLGLTPLVPLVPSDAHFRMLPNPTLDTIGDALSSIGAQVRHMLPNVYVAEQLELTPLVPLIPLAAQLAYIQLACQSASHYAHLSML